jgi:hypothetical protein
MSSSRDIAPEANRLLFCLIQTIQAVYKLTTCISPPAGDLQARPHLGGDRRVAQDLQLLLQRGLLRARLVSFFQVKTYFIH